jgi:hypothetical protein
MRFQSLAAGIVATVALTVGVVLGRLFSRSSWGRQSTPRDMAEPVTTALPAPAEHPAPVATATTRREAPVRLDRLLPLLGMAGLLLTIGLVTWSALGLRPSIPDATTSLRTEYRSSGDHQHDGWGTGRDTGNDGLGATLRSGSHLLFVTDCWIYQDSCDQIAT